MFRVLGGVAALCFAACGGVPASATSALAVSIETLYPLSAGSAWAYDVDSGDQQPVLATTRVAGVQAGVTEVATGQATQRYRVGPEGIERFGQGGFLLKPPFRAGASWASGPDTTARITAVDQHIATGAGAFEACVVVAESNARSGQQVTTTYCPGAGPALVVSEMEVRGQRLRVTASLRGYQIGAEP